MCIPTPVYSPPRGGGGGPPGGGGAPPGGGGAGIRFYCFLVCILFEDVEGVVLQNVSRLVRLVTERCTGDWKKRKRGGGNT